MRRCFSMKGAIHGCLSASSAESRAPTSKARRAWQKSLATSRFFQDLPKRTLNFAS